MPKLMVGKIRTNREVNSPLSTSLSVILTAAERSLRCYNFLIDDGNFLPPEISLIMLRVFESTGFKRKSRGRAGRLHRLDMFCTSS